MPEQQLLSQEEFDKIKLRAEQIKQDQAKVKVMFKELADMYWISSTDKAIGNSNSPIRYNRDAFGTDDIRLTASTSSRDRVSGLHRMMRTTRPQFTVTCENKEYASKIETFLDAIWDASNERRRASLESELTLAGTLFGDENLNVTAVDDLLTGEDLPKPIKRRLTEIRKKTPVLFAIGAPIDSYPVFGEYGKSEHLEVKSIKGKQLRERWGVNSAQVKDQNDYDLWDYFDLENRCVWWTAKGGGSGGTQLKGGPHMLPDIPRFTSITDGTDLFFEEERKRQPFLYGMWKSGLHQREDEILTTLFTSAMSRGVGPLVVIDKSDPQYQAMTIDVMYQGLIRILAAPGKPQLADDKAFDNNLVSLSQMVNQIGERTTIASQTLGENIQPGTPYSGYAMAAQNGRIPLIPIQGATEKVIKDAAMYVLLAIKEGIVVLNETDKLKPSDIPDDVEIKVSLEVDLPQDAFRNAQTLAQLKQTGVPLSNEWMHTMLQVKDSDKMTFDVMAEQAEQEAFKQMMQILLPQMVAMFAAPPQTPPTREGAGATQSGGPMPAPAQVPPGYHQMPDGTMMSDAEMEGYPSTPGGPQAAMAGGAVMPATEPQSPNAPRGTAY